MGRGQQAGGLSEPLRRRFGAAVLLLIVPAAAMLLLTFVYVSSSLRHRANTVRAVQETMTADLQQLLDILYIEIFRGTLNPMIDAGGALNLAHARGQLIDPAVLVSLITRGRDSIIACECAAVVPASGVLALRTVDDSLAYVGSTDRSVVRERVRRLQVGEFDRQPRRMQLLADADSAGSYMFVFAWGASTGGSEVLNALEVDLDAFGHGWLAELHRIYADSLFGTRDSTHLIGFQVVHPAGDTLYDAGVRDGVSVLVRTFGSGLRVGGALGTEPLAFQLTFGPEAVARVLPGGMPGSPWPVAIGATGLALLVVVLGLLLFWRMRELIAVREQFVSGVSHELRTPLALILLYAESLQLDRPTPDTQRRAAGVIARESRRLIHLVENALQFARGQRPSTAMEILPHDLANLVNGVLDDLAPLAAEHQCSLQRELESSLIAAVDEGALRQIVVNLVDNAMRFGPPGQTVLVTLRSADQGIELAVDDQGSGVPVDQREQIFQPFVRREHEPDGGAGIGLATARQLAELFGGGVSVTDAPGGGARFVLRLPPAGSRRSSPVGAGQAVHA